MDLVFGRGDLSELKTSIAAQGLLTPLLIARTADGYELLAGHRRLQCIQELGVPNVPCRLVITQEPEGGGAATAAGSRSLFALIPLPRHHLRTCHREYLADN